jgi:hypothetical protein
MDEMDLILPPDLDTALDKFFAGSRPDPAFAARLEAQLRQRQIEMVPSKQKSRYSFSGTRRSFMQTLRARPILAVIVAILALLALSGIAYAIGRLAGFIPGFGFTSQGGSVYVLAEPMEATVGGVRLRVNQAVNDAERFWVELTASGLSDEQDFSKVFVLLPSGEKIQLQTGGSSESAGGETKLSYLFPPLAGGTQELTFLVEGLGGQDFNLPLKLRPAKAGEIVPVQPEGNLPLQSENQNGVRLVLDHVAVDSRKMIFQVSLRYDQPNTWVGGPWNVTLSDAAGALYSLTDVTPDTMDSGDTHVYETLPFAGVEQLVLTLVSFPSGDTLPMFVDFSMDGPSFTFDPGANPQAGQRWELNQALSAGGFDLKVVGATLTDEPGLVFEVESGPSVTGVLFYSPDPLMTGATGGSPVQGRNLTSVMTFSRIPEQPFEVRLMRIYYQAKGPWQIYWQPPVAPTPAADAPTPTAAPTLAPQPTPTLAISDPILREVQQLTWKFDATLQQEPGWVHIVTESTTEPPAGQVFPPPYYKGELWFEVDAEGYVTRSVTLDYNDAGQIIQQAAAVGNYAVNFTYGDSRFNPGPSYRISLDILTRDLSQATQYGSRVIREESTCDDGRSCLLITLWDTSAGSGKNPGEMQAFSGSGRRVWIDRETGQQVKEQRFWRSEDGHEVISSTTSYILVEKVDSPPQEILDILAKIIVPFSGWFQAH